MFRIYKYTNNYDGKVYIGQTSVSLEERAQTNGRNYRECRRFYDAIQQYGWGSFTPDVLCEVDTEEEADEAERYFIAMYMSDDPAHGYNLESGGRNKATHSAETVSILSEKAKKRYEDPTNNPMYGKRHSEETRAKMRNAKLGENNPMYGKPRTERQKKYCCTTGKKLNLSYEQRRALGDRMRQVAKNNVKRVMCVEDGIIFESVSDAAKHYGVSKSTMSGCLSGYQKVCRGKHFVFYVG